MSSPRPCGRAALVLLAALAATLVVVPTASAGQFLRKNKDGVRYIKYTYGPIKIIPGANDIKFEADKMRGARPSVDGYITYFRPDLVRKNGKVPRVDVIHLHHAVWLINGYPTFAAGEEKSVIRAPKGFGWAYSPKDQWILNHMIHNLTPNDDEVYVTWTLGFIPKSDPRARDVKTVKTQWMDVEGLQVYPVFDVLKGSGRNGRFTYPTDAPNAYADRIRRGRGPRNQWVVPYDTTAVGTVGHLHPGGLWTDMYVTRNGRTVRVFKSRAKYYEPAGPVSWDVSMTATKPNWRVALKKGDIVSITGTYETRRGSWYESMAIMPFSYTADRSIGGKDPFTEKVETEGGLTHGHLPENDNHGGGPSGLPDARRLPDGPRIPQVPIRDFIYTQGDLSLTGTAGRPPLVAPGQPLSFLNEDAGKRIYHTVTSCKSPCNRLTGVAYPLANDPRTVFDSAELGLGGEPTADRTNWQTPPTLGQGTYNYFCRIHPFMRGAFRVKA
jgi:plastocyanin